MNVKKCSICGTKLIKYGKTRAGSQRGYCSKCRFAITKSNENNTFKFKRFLNGLVSKDSERDLKIPDRTFRQHNEEFWKYGALPTYVDEIHKVIFLDGLYLSRDMVLLIACTKDFILSGYLASSENSKSGMALLSKIAPPEMVVSDGSRGLKMAIERVGPGTVVQRCLFHIFQQTRRYTTLNPRLEAGKELLRLSSALLHIDTLEESYLGTDAYIEGLKKWGEFLEEKSKNEYGQLVYTHERLRRARRGINSVLNDKTMFTYLNNILADEDKLPRTNNVIEGKFNSQLRAMLRNHRGLPKIKRAKACFGGCYLHTEAPQPVKDMLKDMPTEEELDLYVQQLDIYNRNNAEVELWGDSIVWNELHTPTPYPFTIY